MHYMHQAVPFLSVGSSSIMSLGTPTPNAKPRNDKELTAIHIPTTCSTNSTLDEKLDYQKALIAMVKERNIETLNLFGGFNDIAASLRSDLKDGICATDEDADLAARRQVFGVNGYEMRTPAPSAKSFLRFFIEEVPQAHLIIILFVCAVISIIFGIIQHGLEVGWHNGAIAILFICLVVASSAATKLTLSRQFIKSWEASNDFMVEVMRNRVTLHVSVFAVVVGDVISLKPGDQIPADALLFSSTSSTTGGGGGDDFCITMTDESGSSTDDNPNLLIMCKESYNPFLLSGWTVVHGRGHMLVTAVGMRTTWGQNMSTRCAFAGSQVQTPLQGRLGNLTSNIMKIGLMVAFLVLVLLIIHYFTGKTLDKGGQKEFKVGKTKFRDIIEAVEINFLGGAVAILACAIPGGYDAVFSLTLAYSIKRMLGKGCSVAQLSACETLASITTICTDITASHDIAGARAAVASCKRVGIDVKMVTETDVDTAKRMARGCGILTTASDESENADEIVIEVAEFFKYSSKQNMKSINKIHVVAMCSAHDKAEVARFLKGCGHVVAVIGNDIEDVPALQLADIGFWMGKQGSAAAILKSAASIVVVKPDDDEADHNLLGSIVEAVRCGRFLHYNIQRFIQFQITMYASALVTSFATACYSGKVPLATFQILWQRLIAGTVGVVGLARDSPSIIDLSENHYSRRPSVLFSTVMIRNIVGLVSYQVTVLWTLQYNGFSIFTTFVFCQVFNLFNAREFQKKNIFTGMSENKLLLALIVVAMTMHVVIMECFYGVSSTKKPSLLLWCLSMGLSASSLIMGFLIKWIMMPTTI